MALVVIEVRLLLLTFLLHFMWFKFHMCVISDMHLTTVHLSLFSQCPVYFLQVDNQFLPHSFKINIHNYCIIHRMATQLCS